MHNYNLIQLLKRLYLRIKDSQLESNQNNQKNQEQLFQECLSMRDFLRVPQFNSADFIIMQIQLILYYFSIYITNMIPETEVRQIKQFQSVTNIRKITQQTLAPIIKKLQIHIQNVMQQTQKTRAQNSAARALSQAHYSLQQRCEAQAKQLEQLNDKIGTLSGNYMQEKRDNEVNKQSTRTQIEFLRKQLIHREQKLTQILRGHINLQSSIKDVKINSKIQIEGLHLKMSQIYKDTLGTVLQIKSKYNSFQNILEITKGQFQLSKSKLTEANKRLELYLSQRQQIFSKMEYLYNHIFGHVSLEEFDKYKKYHTLELQSTIQRVQSLLNEFLPQQSRQYLMQAKNQTVELRKIKGIQLNLKLLEDQNKRLQEQLNKQIRNVQQSIGKVNLQIQKNIKVNEEKNFHMKIRVSEIEEKLHKKIEQDIVINRVSVLRQFIQKQLSQEVTKLRSRINSIIEDNRKQIFSTVYQQIPTEQTAFWAKLKKSIPRIEQIQLEVEQRCQNITQIANNLTGTLERFSNRITKIKTDMELSHEAVVSDVKVLKKLRQQYQRRYKVIGKIFSYYSQLIILLFSLEAHNQSVRFKNLNYHQQQVFVSFADGLIFEFPNSTSDETIIYRKKQINKLDLTCAGLTCFLSIVDSLFQQEFLGWEFCKPSSLFRVSIMQQLEHQKGRAALNVTMSKTINLQKQQDGGQFPSNSKPLEKIPSNFTEENMFTKTSEIRRRSYNKLGKIGQRHENGSQTSRMKSGRLVNNQY